MQSTPKIMVLQLKEVLYTAIFIIVAIVLIFLLIFMFLPDKNKDHALTGNWIGHRKCHILPDWLLIYRIEEEVLILTLARSGTHSDLFGK